MAHPDAPPHDKPLTPKEAAAHLRGLEGFEQRLTQRVGGLTCMVWGVVAPGIFVSYGVAALAAGVPNWVFVVLWAPWVVLGVVLTRSLWALHAISLRATGSDPPRRGWAFALAMLLFFGAALAGLHVLPSLGLHVHAAAFHFMLAVNGLAAFLIVVLASLRAGRLAAAPLLVSGVWMLGMAFVLPHLVVSTAAVAFATAATAAVGYFGAGFASFVRG